MVSLFEKGHHECEFFSGGREHEAAESCHNWQICEKNPGHEKFISAQVFKDNYLPRLHSGRKREVLRCLIDRTVRLRVYCTSIDRPDDDAMVEYRGTGITLVGTGFVRMVRKPEYNRPCFCDNCHGIGTRKKWSFSVETCRHVVFNTEEAKRTKVDLFYDDASCKQDGRMKSVRAVEVVECRPDRDWCEMLCTTCDEDLGERIESAMYCWLEIDKLNHQDVSDLGLLPSCDKEYDPVLIVSHPHGQPKKISMGDVARYPDEQNSRVEYNTPTCPGSSGALVFFYVHLYGRDVFWLFSPLHSGSYGKTSTEQTHKLNLFRRLFNKLWGHESSHEQLNFGYNWF
ncbi:hypothetical protein ElyMa_004730300 [Elysia marginata]|uniref:Uncharacterized protein n=1 Tax=Elysia marginata TaxID=1093978 RepID=A0AAV4IFS4_9GAST|nr:hypothetical protein ElyMa_004730300 [Elysia marginata]